MPLAGWAARKFLRFRAAKRGAEYRSAASSVNKRRRFLWLPQSQGLAVADKVAGNDRVTICTVSDGASMEGEAKEAFAAIPGLASKGRLNPFVMIISDNDTKLSGRITKDAYSMEPTFTAMAPRSSST